MIWVLTIAAAILLPFEMAGIVFLFRHHGDDIEGWLDEKRRAVGEWRNTRHSRSTSAAEPRPMMDAT